MLSRQIYEDTQAIYEYFLSNTPLSNSMMFQSPIGAGEKQQQKHISDIEA